MTEEKSNEQRWSEPSLAEWVETMLREGYTEIVKDMMKNLPEESKEKYREIYRRIKAEGDHGAEGGCSE